MNASIDVRPAEVVGLIGESGSGKSTLAAAMLRLLPAHGECIQGSVLFDDRDLLTMDEPALRRVRGAQVSLIAQDPATALNPVIKVGEQISEVLRAHLAMTRRERKTYVKELLREVGFDDPERVYAAYPHQLSGGQRQRVVIAQAVACRPALVIADEPTSKLDSPLQAQILALMAGIIRRHGTALLLITHDPALLAGFADRVVVTRHPALPAIAGGPPDLTRSAPGCRFEPRCPERMEICSNHDPEESMPTPSRRVSCFKYGN